jgi:precorrin-2 dehydrogenase/sirohydrochlorin ferrochelatase
VKYYPVFLNLKNRKAVVVGGGRVAERKVNTLLKAGARVTVVSPVVTKTIDKLKRQGRIAHIKRVYRKSDIRDAFIVIAGTSSSRINSRVACDAPNLINVIDMPSEGNFIAPSLVQRGPLTIAISTEGCSPAVSRAIRKELEKLYGPDFARYLKLLEKVRKKAQEHIRNRKRREQFLKELASEEIFERLRTDGVSTLPELPSPLK